MGDIPLPIQTNISGQILTGIAPVHIGAVSNISDILTSLPLTGSIVNITQSNTAIINLSSHNVTVEESPIDLTKIPNISNSVLPDAVGDDDVGDEDDLVDDNNDDDDDNAFKAF